MKKLFLISISLLLIILSGCSEYLENKAAERRAYIEQFNGGEVLGKRHQEREVTEKEYCDPIIIGDVTYIDCYTEEYVSPERYLIKIQSLIEENVDMTFTVTKEVYDSYSKKDEAIVDSENEEVLKNGE